MPGVSIPLAPEAAAASLFLPGWIKDTLDIVQTLAIFVGAGLIPLVIWRDGRRRDQQTEADAREREKRRTTLNLISMLVSDQVLKVRQARFYRYRKFKEGVSGSVNPYEEPGIHQFIHDCFVILNIYDAVCIEIIKETADENMMYEAVRDLIIGTPKTVFEVLTPMLQTDVSNNFPYLKQISLRWQQRALEDKLPVVSRIPANR